MNRRSLSAQREQCKVCSSPEGIVEVACEQCGLDPICDVLDYAEEESGVPAGILLRRQPLQRGETIFRQQENFHSIFAVKSGSFKTSMSRSSQPDQVVGFHFPGELIGVEAMSRQTYPCTARALERSSICELRIPRLPESGRPLEALQASIIDLLGREVMLSHELVSSLVHQSAEQRICGFVLNLSQRLARRKLPSAEFTLTMSRSDIGNYLGLAAETVSRVLTRLHKSGAIRLQRKLVRIVDPSVLERLVEASPLHLSRGIPENKSIRFF
ncbi:MAG: helix-turn-helix domain-containing protein [Gammaproteobacteria bacterium]|nr:helix-turn-helix domain-containing protein [Gammaproteobacteria bacterium]